MGGALVLQVLLLAINKNSGHMEIDDEIKSQGSLRLLQFILWGP